MPDYNSIAWIYDFLVRLVFGKKQDRANKEFLKLIPHEARVLVIGGGTGKIINYLDKLDKSLEVDYVEISSQMNALSKRRVNRTLALTFYYESILDFEGNGYDIILANFFFDQFPQSVGQEIAVHLYPKLKKDGFMIFSDFITTNNFCDRLIIAISIVFLRVTADLRIRRLPNYSDLFVNAKFKQGETKQISRNIISALLYPIEQL